MKFYIAGHNQHEAKAVASMVEGAGHSVACRWLLGAFNRTEDHTEDERAAIALEDVADISEADAVILCASPRRVPGGKFVEAGIAIGQGKPVFVLGHRENMLMWHPSVSRFDSVEALISHLQQGTGNAPADQLIDGILATFSPTQQGQGGQDEL